MIRLIFRKNFYMNKAYLLTILFFTVSLNVFSQCEDGRYQDLIFIESNVQTDVLYGNNLDLNGDAMDLYLDVYTPNGDEETMRPLLIMAHGGSFVGGSKDGTDVVPLCNDFARMGYTVASIQYRLGIPLTLNLQLPATEAVLRGVHDMKSAIRFFRKSVEEDGNPYGIDPDKILIGGVSAGGFITLHTAYMDELSEFPEILDLTVDGLTGGLEGDSGNEGYSSEVLGVVNICGAIGDTTWIQPNDEPLLSFHGPFDSTVPYGSDVLELLTFPVLEVDGSESVHQRADEIGLTNCFEIYEGQGHVPHVSNALIYDTTRAIMSSFISHLVCPDIELSCEYEQLFDVSISESLLNQTFLAYPNPTEGQANFILPVSAEESELVILDQSGREIIRRNLSPYNKEVSLDIEVLSSGIYITNWIGKDFSKSVKLVVR